MKLIKEGDKVRLVWDYGEDGDSEIEALVVSTPKGPGELWEFVGDDFLHNNDVFLVNPYHQNFWGMWLVGKEE